VVIERVSYYIGNTKEIKKSKKIFTGNFGDTGFYGIKDESEIALLNYWDEGI